MFAATQMLAAVYPLAWLGFSSFRNRLSFLQLICHLQKLPRMSKLLIRYTVWEGHMANGGNRGERLQVMLTGEELTVLDSFRFKQRMPSRAAAIRELLKRGLAAEGFTAAAAFGTKSEDFGVTGATPKGRDS
jgi:hypothetical protein